MARLAVTQFVGRLCRTVIVSPSTIRSNDNAELISGKSPLKLNVDNWTSYGDYFPSLVVVFDSVTVISAPRQVYLYR